MVEDIFCFCFESSGGRTSADFPYYPLGFDICDVIGTEAYTVEAAMFAFPFVLQTFCKQFNVERYRKLVSRSTCYYSENQEKEEEVRRTQVAVPTWVTTILSPTHPRSRLPRMRCLVYER